MNKAQDEVWPKVREAYGRDVIVVHKPEGLDYFITTSANLPSKTKEIIKDLAARME